MEKYIVNGKVTEVTLTNGKVVKVSTEYLETLKEKLGIDMDEAVLTWLEDEEYLINEEQEALCAAAKENKSLAAARKGFRDGAKERKKVVRTVKENPVKEEIILNLVEKLNSIEKVSEIVIENKSKIITFKVGDREFKLDLIEKRKPKGE